MSRVLRIFDVLEKKSIEWEAGVMKLCSVNCGTFIVVEIWLDYYASDLLCTVIFCVISGCRLVYFTGRTNCSR